MDGIDEAAKMDHLSRLSKARQLTYFYRKVIKSLAKYGR